MCSDSEDEFFSFEEPSMVSDWESKFAFSILHFRDTIDFDTLSFVNAFEDLCGVIETLGRPFKFVVKELKRKMKGIRLIYMNSLPEKPSLMDIRHLNDCGKNCVDALAMALDYMICFLHEIDDDCDVLNNSLRKCASLAYEKSLKLSHSWLVQTVVETALMTLPTKKQFMEGTLGLSQRDANFQFVLVILRKVLSHIKNDQAGLDT
mmetsp:Transcript_17168/g.19139  ORF Transcript_17168/g.19139 Transcript_17168/m.19139 type:complete len:206 (-) Transcript_17168:158-775(-)